MSSKSYVLITGASSGIGYELAHVFARHGFNLILVARRMEQLEQLSNHLKYAHAISIVSLSSDLTQENAAAELFQKCQTLQLEVVILVNNAGLGAYGKFHDSEWSTDETMIRLNIQTLTQLTHLFLPAMIRQKEGKILNVASTAAFQPGPLMAVYYATKAYVLSFSEAINNELKGSGVSVTVLCPGPTVSEFHKTAKMEKSKLAKSKWVMMDSKAVAEIAFSGLMRKKTIVIPGLINKCVAFSVRFVPRSWVVKISRFLSE